ncbi:hypothetical protein [Streptomyces sp. NPDC001719]
MPPKSAMSPIPPATLPAHRTFTERLRELRLLIDDSLDGIAPKVHSSSTSLSKWLRATELPKDNGSVVEFHDLAAKSAGPEAGLGPHSRDSLISLLEQARAEAEETKLCANCRAALTEEEPRAAEAPDLSAVVHAASRERRARPEPSPDRQKPAIHVGRPYRNASLRRARALQLPASTAQTAAPVPPEEGDRQRPRLPEASWTGLEEVAAHFTGGRVHDAVTILQNAGRTLPVQEVLNAVAACRSAGLNHAAESMLNSAGQRDIRAVLYLASAFNQQRRHADADVLLRSAVRATP